MNYNENYFNCSFYKNQYVENPCELKLGYTENFYGILTLIIISILGIILNIIFLFLNCLKRKKRKRHKALMRRIFLIFPFTDIFTSIYWLVSVIQFSDLERIKQNITLCSVNSLFYIFLITFQFILINILLYHFRKINKNPLDAIYKQNTKLILYLIICFILGFIVSLLAERFQLIGISPMNTCFISVKSGLKNLIFLIPLICMIIAIIQLIHDIFFIYMSLQKNLKNIPFIYSEQDSDFDHQPYVVKASADESPVNIQQIVDFVDSFKMHPDEIRCTVEHLTWKTQMQQVVQQVTNG